MKKIISYFFASLILLTLLSAQDASKDFKTQSISVFKNGTAFYLKSGKVPTKNKVYRITENIPSALFGTFWIQSSANELQFISSYNDEVLKDSKTQAINFAQMLSANLNKQVKLHIGKDEIVEGTVVELEGPLSDKTNPEDFFVNAIVTFKTATNWMTFTVAEIRRIEFLERPNQILEAKVKEKKPIFELNFTSEKAKQDLQMMYLQNGISWTPGYLIELIDEKTAQLTLRAEVINNAEDIKNTDINFVVGIPNFRFANRLSTLVDFYQTFTPAINAGFSNVMRTQTLDYAVTSASALSEVSVTAHKVTGSAEEDLFFYELKDFSLKKGGRGHYPIFSQKIDISHIYECVINGNNANQNYFQEDFLFTPDNSNPVFHSIKVNNESKFPWTTGVAMVVKGTEAPRPISQDQLNYTPIKGNSFVKLTEAPDVKVKHAEREVKREDKSMKNPQNRNYYLDLVTVEGQVKIKNFKAKDIDLNLKRTISGKLLESSTKWLKSERTQRVGQNNITDICWETSIKSGQELIITYQYQVYVPD